MCIALLVESERGPTKSELLAMELDNPHGGGIAYIEGNRIRYKKGLTSAQVHSILKRVPRPCLVHFRWATHGGRAKHLTHPFPLGPRALVSKALTGTAEAVLIHNGVWGAYDNWIPDWAMNRKDQLSDTAVAAYIAEKWEGVLDDVAWSTAVMRTAGPGRADVTLRGHWSEYNGDLYSNFNWKVRVDAWQNRYTSTSAKPTNGSLGHQPSHSAYDDQMWSFEDYVAGRDVLSDDGVPDETQQLYLNINERGRSYYTEDETKHSVGKVGAYPPKDPRWTSDGRLVEGGQVVPFDSWMDAKNRARMREALSNRRITREMAVVAGPVEDLSDEPTERNPIPTWLQEHAEVQAALASMNEKERK